MNTVATPTPTMRPGDLEELPDAELLTMIHQASRGSATRDAACEVLVTRYRPLVRSCVLRYKNSTEPQEELMQVGYVGLLKAINNFDPSFGASLAGYAQPCVSGEIKRHFRDKRWQVHVKRSLQELRLELAQCRCRADERARPDPDGRRARPAPEHHRRRRARRRQADLAFQAASLDSPVTLQDGSASLGDLLGDEDPQLEHVIDMQAVWAHWGELPDREQQLLLMRFYGNMTQSEIGAQLGISQMHVSRLLAEALAYLRERIVEPTAVSA